MKRLRKLVTFSTGMGKDGASELKLMKEKGAVTIAQDTLSGRL